MLPTLHVDVLQANIGLPLLFVGWFEMAIALIPVVAIETTVISIRSGIPWTDVIWSATIKAVWPFTSFASTFAPALSNTVTTSRWRFDKAEISVGS